MYTENVIKVNNKDNNNDTFIIFREIITNKCNYNDDRVDFETCFLIKAKREDKTMAYICTLVCKSTPTQNIMATFYKQCGCI